MATEIQMIFTRSFAKAAVTALLAAFGFQRAAKVRGFVGPDDDFAAVDLGLGVDEFAVRSGDGEAKNFRVLGGTFLDAPGGAAFPGRPGRPISRRPTSPRARR